MTWPQFEQLFTPVQYTAEDRDRIERAFHFAERAHHGQKRATGEPYFNHIFSVAASVVGLGLDAEAVSAALLHDTIEDCSVTKADLKKEFGASIAFLVEGVSKVNKIKYHGVARRVESLRKMFLAVAEDVRVVLIKLCDRLNNMRTIAVLPPEKRNRISLETLEVYAPLAYRLGIGELKGELQDLAFPILYPDEYQWTKREVAERIPQGKRYLDRVKPVIAGALKKEGVTPLKIDFRQKFLYSLWQKLMRYEMDFGRITDLLAMRIIVKDLDDCYKTLGIVHSLWKPLPGRIKDYIALPKPNGYRSLHTTVFCLEGKVTEIQIRTAEMHDEAEHGIAAHWAYEESGKPKTGIRADHPKLAWVRQLERWRKEIGSAVDAEEFLESLKIDLFKDRIFVLTPTGEVIDLPEGSTPVDFAYHIHSQVGDHMMGAKVNGKMVPLSHMLSTGDTVQILTQKNKRPSPDWMNFVRTPNARSKVRAALHRADDLAARIDPKSAKKARKRKNKSH